jgi:hypothetical protein
MRERWEREAATRPDSSAKKCESLGRAEAWSKSLVSNGIQLCLMHGVQWSTRQPVRTVVETLTYLAIANKLFSEEERADKNEKENLSMAERNALKKRADSIFETYGG